MNDMLVSQTKHENIKIYNYLSKLFSQYIDEGVLESIYSESVVNGLVIYLYSPFGF